LTTRPSTLLSAGYEEELAAFYNVVNRAKKSKTAKLAFAMGNFFGLQPNAELFELEYHEVGIRYDAQTTLIETKRVNKETDRIERKKYRLMDSQSAALAADTSERDRRHDGAVTALAEAFGVERDRMQHYGLAGRLIYLLDESSKVVGALAITGIGGEREGVSIPYVGIIPKEKGFGGIHLLFRYLKDVVLMPLGREDEKIHSQFAALHNNALLQLKES
jgi:hypothetical protein